MTTFFKQILRMLAFKNLSQNQIILLVCGFIFFTGNLTLWHKISAIYPPTSANFAFLMSLGVFFFVSTALLLLLICHGKATRWILAAFLVVAAFAAYYMDTFGIIIDTVMLENIGQTDAQEIKGLLNISLFVRAFLFGILPAWWVLKNSPAPGEFLTELKRKGKLVGLLLLTLILVIIPFTAGYAGFIREHKIARMYANPTFFTYSSVKFVTQLFASPPSKVWNKLAKDAHFVDLQDHHELIIMVVGETARFDRFSLNGYHKITNPLLAKEKVVSFKNVSSCGTSTGVSVPCMFSSLDRENYDKDKALQTENALELLAEKGVEVLWRDNNSDSKGVAVRLRYEDFKSPTKNRVCEGECRDIGMLEGLDKFIASKPNKDIMIVLHQMGNHGPEYYRRYPKAFARFQPMCMTGELKDCSQTEIDNSYDNAILYTDYFLSEVISFLKKYDGAYETAMLYVSDHGESLGEHDIYLHAMPYAIAPKEQTHVPAIVWFGEKFDYLFDQVKQHENDTLSHDDVFCSLLVAFELETNMCAAKHAMLMQNLDLKQGKH